MSATTTPRRGGRWQLRDIVLAVVPGVVLGFVHRVLVQAWIGLQVATGPTALDGLGARCGVVGLRRS